MSTALAFALQRGDAPVDWTLGLPFLALAVTGMFVSLAIVHRIPTRPLKGALALTLLVVGMLLALPALR